MSEKIKFEVVSDQLTDEQKHSLEKEIGDCFELLINALADSKANMVSGTMAAMRIVARGCAKLGMDPEAYIKTMCELYRAETGTTIIPLGVVPASASTSKEKEEKKAKPDSEKAKDYKDLN